MSFSLHNVYTNPQSEVNTNDKTTLIKGLKKLSRPIWTRPSFRTRKSAKWNASINLIKEKKKIIKALI